MKKPNLKEMLACRWTSASIGALIVMVLGAIILLVGQFEAPTAGLSYDALFGSLRPNIVPPRMWPSFTWMSNP